MNKARVWCRIKQHQAGANEDKFTYFRFMINYLEGKIVDSDEESVILKLSGGMGFRVFLSPSNLSTITSRKGEVKVHTSLEVKEDDFSLYGFLESEERDFFEFLKTVSGIGPQIALSILEAGSLAEIKRAIEDQNEAFFSQAKGIGDKRAQKIIFELKSKVADYDLQKQSVSPEFKDALEGVQQMGYDKNEAYSALQDVKEDCEGAEEMIKESLKLLGSK